jgi:hypothetical protein
MEIHFLAMDTVCANERRCSTTSPPSSKPPVRSQATHGSYGGYAFQRASPFPHTAGQGLASRGYLQANSLTRLCRYNRRYRQSGARSNITGCRRNNRKPIRWKSMRIQVLHGRQGLELPFFQTVAIPIILKAPSNLPHTNAFL